MPHTLETHRPMLDADMCRITDVLAGDPIPAAWVGVGWDSTVGLNEAAVDFWRYNVPRLARPGHCRRVLTALGCDDALVAMACVDGVLRQHLGLLLTSINTLSMVAPAQAGGVPTAKFYFDLHRADEKRDGDQILSQRDTDPAEIFALVDDISDQLAIPRPHPQTNQILAEYGLRPVLLGTSFGPDARKATLYHSLDDRPLADRYRVVDDFLTRFDDDNYRQAMAILAESGAVPVSIAAYASQQDHLDAKIDFRFETSSLPHHQRFLAMRLLTNPAIRAWLESGVPVDYLGVQINRQGKIRLKFYRF